MNILDQIGNTTLLNIDNIYFKMEMQNPSGSIKDRIAKAMIQDALATGELKPNMTVVESTSGNTGISVAMICATLGLKCLIYAPSDTSPLKIKMMQKYGAVVIITYETISDCVARAKKVCKDKRYYYLDQFNNECNVAAQEIMAYEARIQYNQAINNTHWSGSYHSPDAIVVGVGTGGTFMGLHKVFPNATMFMVQVPVSEHIEGICDGVKLSLIPRGMTIGIIPVSYVNATLTAKWLAEKHGIHCGISSGANYYAAMIIQKKFKHVLTVFPDSGDRYL